MDVDGWQEQDVLDQGWGQKRSIDGPEVAKPTTKTDYLLWLREQTLQLIELLQYGDELFQSGKVSIEQHNDMKMGRAITELLEVLIANNADMRHFPAWVNNYRNRLLRLQEDKDVIQ